MRPHPRSLSRLMILIIADLADLAHYGHKLFLVCTENALMFENSLTAFNPLPLHPH